jgi:hypothetical protein
MRIESAIDSAALLCGTEVKRSQKRRIITADRNQVPVRKSRASGAA